MLRLLLTLIAAAAAAASTTAGVYVGPDLSDPATLLLVGNKTLVPTGNLQLPGMDHDVLTLLREGRAANTALRAAVTRLTKTLDRLEPRGRLYALGGTVNSSLPAGTANTVSRFNPTSDFWQVCVCVCVRACQLVCFDCDSQLHRTLGCARHALAPRALCRGRVRGAHLRPGR
jgi:hypothetical protein